jgi:polysaccharide export outer membrane protein
VSVEVVEYRSQNVFVTGEVRSPNKYSLQANSTLMDALTHAGSVTANAGNWVQITHARQGAAALGPSASAEYDVRVNLRDIQTGKAQNIQVRDGDTIFVPKAELFFVTGYVKNGGPFLHEPGMTVSRAISMAGGISEKGSRNRFRITRIVNGRQVTIKDVKSDDLIQPGDSLEVLSRLF